MRKLKLDADALTVDTFKCIEGGGGEKGTVRAYTAQRVCYTPTYYDCPTVPYYCTQAPEEC